VTQTLPLAENLARSRSLAMTTVEGGLTSSHCSSHRPTQLVLLCPPPSSLLRLNTRRDFHHKILSPVAIGAWWSRPTATKRSPKRLGSLHLLARIRPRNGLSNARPKSGSIRPPSCRFTGDKNADRASKNRGKRPIRAARQEHEYPFCLRPAERWRGVATMMLEAFIPKLRGLEDPGRFVAFATYHDA
jgi:hypothetical protein